ncbi:MAG: MOSC domain-containing protein [Elusimicrobiota bacterium]|nr:MOSC domain-containing protein [Elusimicrobiota bacterium]
MTGKIISINISEKKGTVKKPVKTAIVKKNFGIVGDAHSGSGRQVSFIGWDAVKKWQLKIKNEKLKISYGDFAENITTDGLDWNKAKVRDNIIIGETVKLEITQIGKECHFGCAIRKAVGDCIMPKQGIFAKVLISGNIKVGDTIEVV